MHNKNYLIISCNIVKVNEYKSNENKTYWPAPQGNKGGDPA